MLYLLIQLRWLTYQKELPAALSIEVHCNLFDLVLPSGSKILME